MAFSSFRGKFPAGSLDIKASRAIHVKLTSEVLKSFLPGSQLVGHLHAQAREVSLYYEKREERNLTSKTGAKPLQLLAYHQSGLITYTALEKEKTSVSIGTFWRSDESV